MSKPRSNNRQRPTTAPQPAPVPQPIPHFPLTEEEAAAKAAAAQQAAQQPAPAQVTSGQAPLVPDAGPQPVPSVPVDEREKWRCTIPGYVGYCIWDGYDWKHLLVSGSDRRNVIEVLPAEREYNISLALDEDKSPFRNGMLEQIGGDAEASLSNEALTKRMGEAAAGGQHNFRRMVESTNSELILRRMQEIVEDLDCSLPRFTNLIIDEALGQRYPTRYVAENSKSLADGDIAPELSL